MEIVSLAIAWFPLMLDAQALQWETDYRHGIAARGQGRYEEAKQLLEAAFAGASLDAKDLRRADLDDVLASVYQMLGEPEKAEHHFQEAQAILENSSQVNPALEFLIMADLSAYRAGQGRLKDAESLSERALAICVGAFGEEHTNTATAKAILAQVYMQQDRLPEAEPLLERAVAIHEGTLPATDLDRIASESALGKLYALEGRYLKAKPLLQRASEAAMQLGELHPTFAESLVNLADLYRVQGDSERSGPLLRRALVIYEKSLGADSPRVAYTLLDMSIDAIADCKPALARDQIGRALKILRITNGPDHPTVAVGEYRLAQADIQQRKYSDAELLLKHALLVEEAAYPGGNSEIAACLFELGEVEVLQHHVPEAERYYQKAVSIYERSSGPRSPGLAVALHHYAKLLRSHRSAEARELEARAKELDRFATSLR